MLPGSQADLHTYWGHNPILTGSTHQISPHCWPVSFSLLWSWSINWLPYPTAAPAELTENTTVVWLEQKAASNSQASAVAPKNLVSLCKRFSHVKGGCFCMGILFVQRQAQKTKHRKRRARACLLNLQTKLTEFVDSPGGGNCRRPTAATLTDVERRRLLEPDSEKCDH